MFDNRKQYIPPLFQAIIENEAKRKDLTKGKISDIRIAIELRELQEEFNMLKLAAEEFIRKAKTPNGKT